ncbi:MAG: metallophosphoesterase family protein [Bacteroidales bacterium]
MKILHTSDWHLGNMLYGYDRNESEQYFLEQLKDIVVQQQPDCMIIGGDIYNLSSPSAYVQKMYTDAMLDIHNSCPSMTTVVIAGNHDSPSKLEIDSSLWSCFNVFIVGSIDKQQEEIDFAKHIIEIRNRNNKLLGYVVAIPHFYIRNHPDLFKNIQEYVKQININNLPVILSCHLAVTNSEIRSNSTYVQDMEFFPLEELGEVYDYIALGHIHLPQTLKNSNDRARYCGSPISISFNEQYPHGVSIVEVERGNKPNIQFVEIKDHMQLKTIPKESRELGEVLGYVKNHKEELENCFLRFNVEVQDFLPSNSKEVSISLCKSIGAYFCTFNINRPERIINEDKSQSMTVEEFRNMTVMQIVKKYMKEKNIDIGEDFEEMITYAMEFTEDQY